LKPFSWARRQVAMETGAAGAPKTHYVHKYVNAWLAPKEPGNEKKWKAENKEKNRTQTRYKCLNQG